METLNISARSEDERASALSNFSSFGFSFLDKQFASREGFIIGLMIENEEIQAKAFASIGLGAKRFAKFAERQFIWWNGKKFQFRGPIHVALIERGIRECFKQNPLLMKLLLETAGLTLIHDLGHPESPNTSLPATEFCAILTAIREENLKKS